MMLKSMMTTMITIQTANTNIQRKYKDNTHVN
jgi:hypothetical protein